MRQFKTTQSFLLSKSTSPSVGDTVETIGDSLENDGGGARFQFNGVTGQPASQRDGAAANDADGNRWDMITVPIIVVSEFPVTPLANTLYIKEET